MEHGYSAPPANTYLYLPTAGNVAEAEFSDT
jgi:hypothetical protein